MTKPEPQMMICKRPLNCKEIFPSYCPYRKAHQWSRACAEGHGEDCPACIPIEPEPSPLEAILKEIDPNITFVDVTPKPQPEPTCPECGHLVSEHDSRGCQVGYFIRKTEPYCNCTFTGKCTADWNRANCLDKLTCPTKSDGYLCHYWQPKKPATCQEFPEHMLEGIYPKYTPELIYFLDFSKCGKYFGNPTMTEHLETMLKSSIPAATCPECKGYGQIRSEDLTGEGQQTFYLECAVCNGTGEVSADPKPAEPRLCKMCHEPLTPEYSKCLHCGYENMVKPAEPREWSMKVAEPEMPLYEFNSRYEDEFKRGFDEGCKNQRDADMTWHKEQVRQQCAECSGTDNYPSIVEAKEALRHEVRKAFAEKIELKLKQMKLKVSFSSRNMEGWNNAIDSVSEDIRKMAEEK